MIRDATRRSYHRVGVGLVAMLPMTRAGSVPARDQRSRVGTRSHRTSRAGTITPHWRRDRYSLRDDAPHAPGAHRRRERAWPRARPGNRLLRRLDLPPPARHRRALGARGASSVRLDRAATTVAGGMPARPPFLSHVRLCRSNLPWLVLNAHAGEDGRQCERSPHSYPHALELIGGTNEIANLADTTRRACGRDRPRSLGEGLGADPTGKRHHAPADS